MVPKFFTREKIYYCTLPKQKSGKRYDPNLISINFISEEFTIWRHLRPFLKWIKYKERGRETGRGRKRGKERKRKREKERKIERMRKIEVKREKRKRRKKRKKRKRGKERKREIVRERKGIRSRE